MNDPESRTPPLLPEVQWPEFRYLMWYQHYGTCLVVRRGDFAGSDDWATIQGVFLNRCLNGAPRPAYDWPSHRRLWAHNQYRNVWYGSELAGADGASYEVFKLPETHPGDVRACVDHIRRSFDVVHLRVVRIREWIALPNWRALLATSPVTP